MSDSYYEKIEGLVVPRKLEFGNIEHIKLRNRIAERKRIREDGIYCPCGESKMKNPIVDANKDRLKWFCPCGESIETDRDGENEVWKIDLKGA